MNMTKGVRTIAGVIVCMIQIAQIICVDIVGAIVSEGVPLTIVLIHLARCEPHFSTVELEDTGDYEAMVVEMISIDSDEIEVDTGQPADTDSGVE